MIYEKSYDALDYEGEWVDDKWHGKGTLNLKSGDKYVGDFKNDMRNGHGKYTWSENNPDLGKDYIGDFRDNNYHGYGTLQFKNGDKYQGQFIDGNKHGFGVYYYANGDRYEGEYN
jgi:hypothetical protein